jgi:site-specific DNA-methyltransferase (adenine-specific)
MNRSHFNQGHIGMNILKKNGKKHSSAVDFEIPDKTTHAIFIEDSIQFLKKIPDSSIQFILIDPPYNLDLATWDNFDNYMGWAKQWLCEIERILTDNGNFVVFGGFQYQDDKRGDLLEIMHYLRHSTNLRFVNLIIWYYKNGMGAQRFFSNRHEEILWFSKTKKYYFDLDSVRIPFDEKTKKLYKRDKRLNPESIEKGKNPTNVWEIPRLNANSKERVGHPTQKPVEIIRRLIRGLSYPGSTVLDFFAGSGTTGRVCIEEKRNSIMVDNDKETIDFFKKHLKQLNLLNYSNDFEILYPENELHETLNKFNIEVEVG